MSLGLEALSKVTIFNKYAKYIPEIQRREVWDEIVNRYEVMMMQKYPQLKGEINEKAEFIRCKKVLPSMRALQFAGTAMEVNNARGYNCAYLPVDSLYSFSETMFLLLGGSGVGYSVQSHHINQLPIIQKSDKSRRYLIEDSIIGWADSIKMLMKAYFGKGVMPLFDFRAIRQKGARLITAGGKAPGPEPLKICIAHVQAILDRKKDGEKLTSLECHDIMCHIANSVLAGGIRRSAMISLFDATDEEMITCKYGNWWELNEQRGRANNSVVLERGEVSKKQFAGLWERIQLSGSGEPGIYWTNNKDWGTNPCCFTGDMKLLTPSGYKTFKELAAEVEFEAINKDGEIVPAKAWSNGLKETNVLRLSNGIHVTCTPDHRFLTIDGIEEEAKNLKGKRIMPYFTINEQVSDHVKYGFIQGDAGTGRLDSLFHKGLEIYFGDKDGDVAELFGLDKGKQYVTGFNEILKNLDFSSEQLPNRSLPGKFSSLTNTEKLQFLKGLYTANGSVIKAGRVSFKTTCKRLANQIVDSINTLSNYKIKPYITTNKEKEVKFSNGNYICKESYDVNIASNDGIKWFAENIGFVQEYKKEELKSLIIRKAPLVLSIGNTREKEVFDFSLDDNTHWGVVEGVIAHNCEIALRPFQFCNLCEVNAGDIESQEDLNQRVQVAAFFGTLQAGFTDFHYLRPIWKRTTEKDALLGIGMTGIGSGEILKYNLQVASRLAQSVNHRIADEINIKRAARITCIKPSGTTSCVLKVSSGVHAWYSEYYLRTIRLNKTEPLVSYLIKNHPELCEDDILRPHDTLCVRFPIEAPKNAIMRTESGIDTLERVKWLTENWIRSGHITGENTHNVSATIYVKNDEWEDIGNWMWQNKEYYNGLSVLPFDGGSYKQAPFEEITKEEYEKRIKYITSIDLSEVIEEDDLVDFGAIAACSGGACLIE